MRKYIWLFAVCLFFSLLVLFFVSSPFKHSFFSQGEIRAALDIGSGATNLKIAKVDPQTNRIIKELFEKSIVVPYQKQLEQSATHTFDAVVVQQGIEAIKELQHIAQLYQAKKIVAVATAAFRAADNANQVADEIAAQTGIKVHIISQDEEGILAFRGALGLLSIEPQDAVVWDIGGGSMQLTTLSPQGTYLIEKGATASVPFKNEVIEQVKKQNKLQVSSPNPLNKEEMQEAIDYAQTKADQVNPFIKEKILQPHTQVLAVGSLFNYGILPLVNQKIFDQKQLKTAVTQYVDKTDAQLPGSVVDVAVTNPLLVLGYMQELQIKQVQILKVNNTDGVLTNPPYWL